MALLAMLFSYLICLHWTCDAAPVTHDTDCPLEGELCPLQNLDYELPHCECLSPPPAPSCVCENGPEYPDWLVLALGIGSFCFTKTYEDDDGTKVETTENADVTIQDDGDIEVCWTKSYIYDGGCKKIKIIETGEVEIGKDEWADGKWENEEYFEDNLIEGNTYNCECDESVDNLQHSSHNQGKEDYQCECFEGESNDGFTAECGMIFEIPNEIHTEEQTNIRFEDHENFKTNDLEIADVKHFEDQKGGFETYDYNSAKKVGEFNEITDKLNNRREETISKIGKLETGQIYNDQECQNINDADLSLKLSDYQAITKDRFDLNGRKNSNEIRNELVKTHKSDLTNSIISKQDNLQKQLLNINTKIDSELQDINVFLLENIETPSSKIDVKGQRSCIDTNADTNRRHPVNDIDENCSAEEGEEEYELELEYFSYGDNFSENYLQFVKLEELLDPEKEEGFHFDSEEMGKTCKNVPGSGSCDQESVSVCSACDDTKYCDHCKDENDGIKVTIEEEGEYDESYDSGFSKGKMYKKTESQFIDDNDCTNDYECDVEFIEEIDQHEDSSGKKIDYNSKKQKSFSSGDKKWKYTKKVTVEIIDDGDDEDHCDCQSH